MLEKQIESKVCAYARSLGFLAEKFTSPGRAAVPDRLFTAPNGRMFFIEFKAPGKKPTPLQEADHLRRRSRGCLVYTCDGVIRGKEIIDIFA